MHWQGLTDLTGASYTPIGAGQCRSGRLAGARRLAVQDARRPRRRDQGESRQAEGIRHRAGRHLAPRDRRHAAGPRRSIRPACRGCRPTARRPACRTWSPAACRSRRARCPKRARSSTPARCKSLAVMADKPAALYPNVPTLKSATGSNWTMAAWRGIAAPKGLPAEARDKLVSRDAEDRRQQGLHRLHGAARLRRDLCAAGRVRGVHGQVRRGPGRDDEGGRHRQVTRGVDPTARARAPAPESRIDGRAHELNDAVWGALLLLFSVRAPRARAELSRDPGQQVGPALVSGHPRRRPRRLRRAARTEGPRLAPRVAASAPSGSRSSLDAARQHVPRVRADHRRQRLLHPGRRHARVHPSRA